MTTRCSVSHSPQAGSRSKRNLARTPRSRETCRRRPLRDSVVWCGVDARRPHAQHAHSHAHVLGVKNTIQCMILCMQRMTMHDSNHVVRLRLPACLQSQTQHKGTIYLRASRVISDQHRNTETRKRNIRYAYPYEIRTVYAYRILRASRVISALLVAELPRWLWASLSLSVCLSLPLSVSVCLSLPQAGSDRV